MRQKPENWNELSERSQYDSYPGQRCGWLDGERTTKGAVVADDRFEISPEPLSE
jgi:hypothetical protein